MVEVYNGYSEKFLTGKELKDMYFDSFFCASRHHETVYDITISEYLDFLKIDNNKTYRIFYNDNFCKIWIPDTDTSIDFFSHTKLKNTIYQDRHLNRINKLCPICNKEMVLKNGKFGHFYSCPDYPKCKGSRKVMILGNFNWGGFKPCNIDE